MSSQFPSPEVIAEIALLRQKHRDGTATLEDTKRGIELLRADRLAMPATASKSRTKAVPISSESLLDELDNL